MNAGIPTNEVLASKNHRDDTRDASAETEEQYRARVYGDDNHRNQPRRQSSLRRLSKRLSVEVGRRRSSITEALPETPAGWAVLTSLVASAMLSYEISLQSSLTGPPMVYGQVDHGPLQPIYQALAASRTSILRRDIAPSLFVGTRGVVSSIAAYALAGPANLQHSRIRELLRMPADGAQIALDWELPDDNNRHVPLELRIQTVDRPLVLILHGINNDASFGYMRSLMRACTDRGWYAVGLNFRGCGGVPLATPRGYNGAYTGDVRSVVYALSTRLASHGQPLLLVGNSLGANLVAKYLGEEGLSASLPSCVAGGVTLGNPMAMDSTKIDYLFSPLMALGAKKTLIQNWASLSPMNNASFRDAIRRAMLAVTLADFDNALAPVFARNSMWYPFAFMPQGYQNGAEYWQEGGSFRLTRHVSVPLLQLIAGDDFLVYGPFRGRMSYSVANPNIMVVETKCGGHLGWQEAPPDEYRSWGRHTSWADVATCDFIAAVLANWTRATHDAPKVGDNAATANANAADTRMTRAKL